MQNFIYQNPTRIVFGKGAADSLGREAVKYGSRALLVIGKSSARSSGLYDRMATQLAKNNIAFETLDGVQSNPVLADVKRGITLAREFRADMVIGIGGGSVVDTAKAVAAGVPPQTEVWDYFTGKAKIREALPTLAVLTLAATGTEMNPSTVITNEETKEKLSASSVRLYPKASFLDPELTFSVDKAYSAYGAVDAITHLLEPYFNNQAQNTLVQDGMTESLVRAVKTAIEAILLNATDYDARASMMWAACVALNGITSAGVGTTEWPVHMIEHSLSALYDVPHGAGLAVVLPAWLRYALERKAGRIAQLGKNAFPTAGNGTGQTAEQTIDNIRLWYASIGCPTSLYALNIPAGAIPGIAANAARTAALWGLTEYNETTIESILRLCAT